MNTQNSTITKLAETALMAALCYVSFTFLQIKIPVPGGDATSIHIGNAFCVLAALLIGGVYGGLSGAIGMGIADLMDPVYITGAPKTFVLKFCIGLITGLVAHKIAKINESTDKKYVFKWITVFNVLYQFIYFSGICADISGYEGFTVLCNPDQDEVDGDVYAALVVYDIVRYFMGGAWFMALPIIASLLNFIIFFLGTRNLNRYNPKEIHRRNQFKRAMGESKTVPFPGGSKSGEVTKHKCAVCGRTEKDDPNLEFRFCSKCNGNYEYCQDHLYTHIHKK